jgi:hypothetical protein
MQEIIRAARRSLALDDTDVVVPEEIQAIRDWVAENQGRTETTLTRPIPGQERPNEWWCCALPSAPGVRCSVIQHLMGPVMTLKEFNTRDSRLETLDFLINPVCDHKAIEEAIKCRKEGKDLFKRSRALTKLSGAPYHAIRILKQEGKL